MRNVVVTTAVLLASLLTLASAPASADIQLNSGLYLNGVDQKPVLRITSDESGHSLQIEGPRVPVTTLSLNDNHNFDTPNPISNGIVSADFVRKCTKRGAQKPCDKGLYDDFGKLRIQEGDEYNVTARLLVLSSESVLQMQWTTYTRENSMIAQKFTKQVLKWQAPPKNAGDVKEPIAL